MPTATTDKELAGKILAQAAQELAASRRNKLARINQIKENEDLYLGLSPKSIRNPFNECYPFMAGFVDHLRSKIDDDSELSYSHQAEADLKKSLKIQAFYDRVSKSVAPNDSWAVKHRYAKNNAIFSGVAIYKYFAESDPKYCSYLEVISHYDFHNEPRGGGQIENHLFCGQDNVYRTIETLEAGTQYDQTQVALLKPQAENSQSKDNDDYDTNRNNRAQGLGQDPRSNNFAGQATLKLVEWYTTYKGKRYYLLFSETAMVWLRCCELTELFPDGLWPYITWQTNEDPDVFWSKAPADDARPVAKIINTMINQELYNRQKRNYGQRAYDAEMFPNVAALADWRPDGLIPVDTKNGSRNISNGLYEVKVGDLNGTLDLVTWMDNFTGKQVGNTASDQGATEGDKKVGVFQGEVAQTERLIGVKNRSYRDALSRIGLLFLQGATHNLTTEEAIKIMGGKGVEWDTISPDDLNTEQPLTIQPVGGTGELQLQEIEKKRKLNALTAAISNPKSSLNPQWLERQLLILNGFTTEDIKDAWSTSTSAEAELLSEAAQAEKDIVQGKTPKLNNGATEAFIQHIIDFEVDTDNLTAEIRQKLLKYAMDHIDIALANMNRNVKQMMADRAKLRLSTRGGQNENDGTMNANGGNTGGATTEINPTASPLPNGGFNGGDQPAGTGSALDTGVAGNTSQPVF